MYVLCTVIYIVNRIVSGEIYTAGKSFTLLLAVTVLTNFTSVMGPVQSFSGDHFQPKNHKQNWMLLGKISNKDDFETLDSI